MARTRARATKSHAKMRAPGSYGQTEMMHDTAIDSTCDPEIVHVQTSRLAAFGDCADDSAR